MQIIYVTMSSLCPCLCLGLGQCRVTSHYVYVSLSLESKSLSLCQCQCLFCLLLCDSDYDMTMIDYDSDCDCGGCQTAASGCLPVTEPESDAAAAVAERLNCIISVAPRRYDATYTSTHSTR